MWPSIETNQYKLNGELNGLFRSSCEDSTQVLLLADSLVRNIRESRL